jgi:hypothetical protein
MPHSSLQRAVWHSSQAKARPMKMNTLNYKELGKDAQKAVNKTNSSNAFLLTFRYNTKSKGICIRKIALAIGLVHARQEPLWYLTLAPLAS